MLFKLRVDRSRGNIPHLRFGFRDKKEAVTSGTLQTPPSKTKNKKGAKQRAKRKGQGKEKTNIYSYVYTERLIKDALYLILKKKLSSNGYDHWGAT
jgi:hypothetical protein